MFVYIPSHSHTPPPVLFPLALCGSTHARWLASHPFPASEVALTGFSTQPTASTVIDWRVSRRDKGGQGVMEGKLCVCPPNNNENRWAIDTAGRMKGKAIEVPLLGNLASSKF